MNLNGYVSVLCACKWYRGAEGSPVYVLVQHRVMEVEMGNLSSAEFETSLGRNKLGTMLSQRYMMYCARNQRSWACPIG